MNPEVRLAADQLGRMRGMTRYYHQRFFSDVRFTTTVTLALFVVGWWNVEEAFLLIPVVALLGAATTAFDASYLIFSRQYAARLEAHLNRQAGTEFLVAAALESTYLFPLDVPKVVTVPLAGPFSWFGFMTILYTATGVAAFGFGLALGVSALGDHGSVWTATYLASVGIAVVATLLVGVWWFPMGEGERRLRAVLDRYLPVDDGG